MPQNKKEKPKIAVILFPGINMEKEMVDVCIASGMDAEIVRWNEHSRLSSFDGYAIGGGFSYEDRIRAGVIAAQEPLMKEIKKQSSKGKPVLGVCNGAQILVESGLIPGIKNEIQMALAPNINPVISGYYNVWVNIKNNEDIGRCAFTRLIEKNEVIPVPIAHGEGRFTAKDNSLLKELIKNKQIIFRYSTKEGEVSEEFPVTPNGAMHAIAGICNKKGNVMAMMPHPERSSWIRQLPDCPEKINAKCNMLKMESEYKGRKIFLSMKDYIEKEML